MADNFDPLKKAANTASEGFYLQGGQNNASADGNYHQTGYNCVWARQSSTDANNSMYFAGESQAQPEKNKRSNFFNSFIRSSSRPNNSYDSGQGQVHYDKQRGKSDFESEEHSSEVWNDEDPSESYPYEEGGQEDAYVYQQEEYYENEKPYKKKGFSAKIDRLVRRIPIFGKIDKRPPTALDSCGSDQQFQYNQSSVSFDSKCELSVDQSALNQRYMDRSRLKSINLYVNDQSQPVDVRIHRETNKIYACDIGRSVVEIFDINGTFLHAIKDPTILKFQPTAIAVAFDQTIILASHFNNCLHMYSPSQNASNRYSYKQFRLGSPGNQIHQFYHPAGIAIDHKDGNLYVCDRGNYRIQVIRPEGICERVIELILNSKKRLPLDPVRVEIQPNLDQLVCIVGNGDALCFLPKQTSGRVIVDPLFIFDENAVGLENASGLAVDTHDRIFISDTGHHRIVICTPEGVYITSFGSKGSDPGQLKYPCGLDVTRNGTLIVTDPGNKRLQLFGTMQEQRVVENNPLQESSTDMEHDIFLNL